MQVTVLTREFIFNGSILPDPGPTHSPEDVRSFHATRIPTLLTAQIDGPVEKKGKLVYTFQAAVKDKG